MPDKKDRFNKMRNGGLAKRLAPLFLVLFLHSACTVGSAKNRYLFAEKLWTDGKYEAAVAEFEKVAQKDPAGRLGQQALFRAANTQAFFLQQYEPAAKKFSRLADTTTEPELAWESKRQLGELLFSRLGQHEASIAHYRKLLQDYPKVSESPEFLFRIAKSLFLLGQFSDALVTYSSVEERYPGTPQAEAAALERGITFYTRGEHLPGPRKEALETYQQAIQAFQRFIQKYPQSVRVSEARFGHAECLEEMDQLEAAAQIYASIEKTYPSPNVIRIKLARIRERQNQKSR